MTMAMVGQFGIGRHLAGAVQRSPIEAIDPQPKDRPPLLDRFQHLDRSDAAGIMLERIALQDHQVSAFARLKGALALFKKVWAVKKLGTMPSALMRSTWSWRASWAWIATGRRSLAP